MASALLESLEAATADGHGHSMPIGPIGPPTGGPSGPNGESTARCPIVGNANKEIGMDTPARYFDLWFIHISYPNLIVIGVMIVLFAVALVAPFPHGSDSDA